MEEIQKNLKRTNRSIIVLVDTGGCNYSFDESCCSRAGLNRLIIETTNENYINIIEPNF
jgi:hypothetical protein